MKHNRWLVVVGAILVQIALGGIYAWSVFTHSLLKDPYNFTIAQTQAIFSASLLSFTLAMIFTNIKMGKIGFRPFLILGGLALGGGYMLSYHGALYLGSSFIIPLICVGIIGGAGTGFASGVSTAVCIKWFPDKKALISGLTAAGFCAGTILWIKIGGSWFGLVESLGVQSVFLYYGIAFIILVFAGSIFMSNPPEGYVPEGYRPPEAIDDSTKKGNLRNYTWQTMINQPAFWGIWLIFIFSGMAGLMVIGTIQLLGVDIITNNGLDVRTACTAAGSAMALFAVFSVPGIIIWSKIGNKLGLRTALFLMTFTQGILMLTLFTMVKTPIMLMVYASVIGFNFSGTCSLFHTAAAILFGAKYVSSNYLFIVTAYGIAGIAGPSLGGIIRDNTGSFRNAFIVAGIGCIFASLLALAIKMPGERRVGGRRLGEREEEPTEDRSADTGKRKILGTRKSSDRRIEKGVAWSP